MQKNAEKFDILIHAATVGARRMDEGAKYPRLRRAPTAKHGNLGIPQTCREHIQSKILRKAEAQ